MSRRLLIGLIPLAGVLLAAAVALATVPARLPFPLPWQQPAPAEPGRGGDLEVEQVPNLAAAYLRPDDLGGGFELLDFDIRRDEGSPRTDHVVAYEQTNDAASSGPAFVEMRLVVYSGDPASEPVRSMIDSGFAQYVARTPPGTEALAPPPGLERFRWFHVVDDLIPDEPMVAYVTIFRTPSGFASLVALGQEGRFSVDYVAALARVVAARLGA